MIGKPKYEHNMGVVFMFNDQLITGRVAIIDAYGTFEQNEEPSYDIFCDDDQTLYKHIRESKIIAPDIE